MSWNKSSNCVNVCLTRVLVSQGASALKTCWYLSI